VVAHGQRCKRYRLRTHREHPSLESLVVAINVNRIQGRNATSARSLPGVRAGEQK
jgi:hypothetical protein